MQVFKFNVGSRSVERAIADAIGQGIAVRRDNDEGVPQRFAELIARLDETPRDQLHNLAKLQSRKSPTK